MTKLALIVLAGASFLGTGIASAQYSFGDEGYWQRRGREYGLPCDNTRWCAQYAGGGRGGGTNCGFISYEQCMMTAFGAGAWCVQNPWYLAYGDGSQKTAATARRARSRQR